MKPSCKARLQATKQFLKAMLSLAAEPDQHGDSYPGNQETLPVASSWWDGHSSDVSLDLRLNLILVSSAQQTPQVSDTQSTVSYLRLSLKQIQVSKSDCGPGARVPLVRIPPETIVSSWSPTAAEQHPRFVGDNAENLSLTLGWRKKAGAYCIVRTRSQGNHGLIP